MKFTYYVICITLTASIYGILLREENLQSSENVTQEATQNFIHNLKYAELYRNISHLSNGMKYILLWSKDLFFSGQWKSIQNCFVTQDRNFFGGDIKKFDAVAFSGRYLEYNLDKSNKKPDLPQSRAPHQKYVFYSKESSVNYPICNPIFDEFFNWTSTYRLDSDFPCPYIFIKNMDGEIVGPNLKINWFQQSLVNEPEIDEELYNRLKNKNKAAAWFVSNCNDTRRRKEFVDKLQKTLDQYGLKVDIYGDCGNLTCNRQSDCYAILGRDYYFYLALENSIAEDYVTEKVLLALQNEVVPIVFGGADYERFLPPRAYLDARSHSPEKLAWMMDNLIKSTKEYSRYFIWKYNYTFHSSEAVEEMCNFCAALNNKTVVETKTSYKNFRVWWLPNYDYDGEDYVYVVDILLNKVFERFIEKMLRPLRNIYKNLLRWISDNFY